MKCPKCQHDNPKNAKFCVECGSKFEVPCPACGFGNSSSFKFCAECGHNLTLPSPEPIHEDLSFDEKIDKIQRYLPKGLTEKILSQRDRIEGERKQVTVMFCDLEGFTSLSEKLDPEEAYDIVDQIYELLIHKVHDYEGTVNEMTGDGIVALFGAPIALEDAPQRAIRSAMAIHREMARLSDRMKEEREGIPPLRMRVGIHTGPVVVGTVGNNLRVEFKAVGDTVNLASRMEGLAEPGATYVTDDTFKLTEGFFRFEALGEKEVKGKKEPVKVYRVIAPSTRRTRFDVSAERGLTPFVGRERELELLLDGFERAKEGRGQAFSIIAEAGLGKSRLLYEFRKAVTNEDLTFLEGRCLSYSRNVAYHLHTDILKANFNVKEGDNDQEITEKLIKGLKVLGADETSMLPYLLELLSVKQSGINKLPTDPELIKDRIKEALRKIVLLGSELRPLILAYEDIHWADNNSEEILSYVLDSIPRARVFIIFTYRPEFVHTWGTKSFHSQLTLNRLSNHESLTMVYDILDTENIDKDLEELILANTEGVPFFIEEFLKSLKDLKIIKIIDGKFHIALHTGQVTVPSTIQDMIMARVDSLPDTAKELLQIASVIERQFEYELIKRVVGTPEQDLLTRLSILKESELLYERGIYPQSTYIFKHSLTREVVYDSLLLKRRKEIHERVGKSIFDIYSNRLEEFYEVLSYHYSRSNDLVNALQYLRLSGDKAIRKQSYLDAYHFYQEAILVLNKMPNTEENKRKHLEIVNLMFVPIGLDNVGVPDEYIQILQEGEALAIELGDIKTSINIQSLIGICYWLKGEHLKALPFNKRSFAAAQDTKDIELIGSTAIDLANVYFPLGLYVDLVNILPSVIDELEVKEKQFDRLMSRNFNQYSCLCGMCGLAQFCLGDFQKGEAFYRKGLNTAITIGQDQTKGQVEHLCGFGYLVKGDWMRASEHLRASVEYLEKAKFSFYLGMALSGLGYSCSHLGDLETGRKHIEAGMTIKSESWVEAGLADQYFMLSYCQFESGNSTSARDSVEKALELSKRHHEKLVEGQSLIWLGNILHNMQPAESEEIENFFLRGINILTELKAKPFLSIGYLFLGEFLKAVGRHDEALKNLHLAEVMFQGMGMDYWLAKTQGVLETV
ncbi:MAG: AAA family ATPase [Deltaproteobacteria bacterium]|nr:AAA family ATPase [Deltaproteobacteria bacterium]